MRRKLRPVNNQFAENARLDKAMKLAAAIRLGYGPVNEDVIEALWTQPAKWWRDLAKELDLADAPSAACIKATIGLLTQELPMHDSPLRGLR